MFKHQHESNVDEIKLQLMHLFHPHCAYEKQNSFQVQVPEVDGLDELY